VKALRAYAHALRRAWAIARSTPLLSLLVVVALATALALPLFAAAVAEGALAAVERIDAKPTVSVFLGRAGRGEGARDPPSGRSARCPASRRSASSRATRRSPSWRRSRGWATSWPGSTATRSRTRWSPRCRRRPGTAAAVTGRIRSIPGVASVQSDVAWVTRLAAIARAIRWVGVLLGALMARRSSPRPSPPPPASAHSPPSHCRVDPPGRDASLGRPALRRARVLQGAAAGLGAAAIVAAALAGLGGILRPTFPAIADLLAVPALPWALAAVGAERSSVTRAPGSRPGTFRRSLPSLEPRQGARSYPTGLVGNFRLAFSTPNVDC
jgi:hypothetical protein